MQPVLDTPLAPDPGWQRDQTAAEAGDVAELAFDLATLAAELLASNKRLRS